jgi:hypothetical protein
MSGQDPILDALMKVVLKHERHINLIDALAQVAADHCRLLEAALVRCGADGCTNAATVKHVYGVMACDHCAAEATIRRSESEAQWHDLPNAAQVRRVQDHLWVMARGEETPTLQ